MKRHIIISCLCILASFSLLAQSKPYNVVFDLTSKDTADQKSVIRWVSSISSADPTAQLEVVLYGQSLDMVVKDRSVVEEAIKGLAANKNVSFKVCNIAMKHHNLQPSQLLPGVQVVPDGIYEIISRQSDGWGYIKVAH